MTHALNIIYEDPDFLVVMKPAGMLVYGMLGKNSEETLVDMLRVRYPEIQNVGDKPEERPGIVHRLDRETSGVLLVARTQKFFEYAKRLFQNHEIQKTYCALTYGKLEKPGVITTPIGLKPGTTKRSVHGKRLKMMKEAVTEYIPLHTYLYTFTLSSGREKEEWYKLVRVMQKTGRTHQIRVHCASIGHAVVGDALYGSHNAKENYFGLTRQFLHAEAIEFTSRAGKRMKIEAALPEELEKVLTLLKK